VDLNKLVTGTISLTRPRWFDMPRQHGRVVEVREDFADVGLALCNAAEVRDALTNLLFNAVDAMPQGGAITVRTRREGEEIVLAVEDTGVGMSDEVRERCLEPFFSTKGLHGTGLGLSMVHGIVERNRGRMTIDSQLGRGTTIRLFLARAPESQAPTLPHAESGPPRRKRIVCVDDDIRILQSLEGMLRQLGHEVATTTSGAEAIDWVGTGRFDVLITDLGMPNVDGREVARSAKRLAPHTGVLLFTGWADRLAIEGDFPEGVDQVLGKPIAKQKLQQAILQVSATVAEAV
jgi:CheY-like chemotaxis protein/anti-sigma regulatory factor (Ser/Thr protein kinase)